MASLAMTSPLAPVVAAAEGLRRRHPELLAGIAPGLIMAAADDAGGAVEPESLAVLTVAGWTRARRVPLLIREATHVDGTGRLGISGARVAVLAGDPAAGRPGVVVARDRDELRELVQASLCALTTAPELTRHLRRLTALWSPRPRPTPPIHSIPIPAVQLAGAGTPVTAGLG